MNKFIFTLLSVTLFVTGCKKHKLDNGCEVKVCTKEFVSLNVYFTNNYGTPINVNNFSVYNQRTKTNLILKTNKQPTEVGNYVVADDNMLDQLSTEGDNVLISGTYPVTNQTKTAVVNISGGCNCHVAKKSGPGVINFD